MERLAWVGKNPNIRLHLIFPNPSQYLFWNVKIRMLEIWNSEYLNFDCIKLVAKVHLILQTFYQNCSASVSWSHCQAKLCLLLPLLLLLLCLQTSPFSSSSCSCSSSSSILLPPPPPPPPPPQPLGCSNRGPGTRQEWAAGCCCSIPRPLLSSPMECLKGFEQNSTHCSQMERLIIWMKWVRTQPLLIDGMCLKYEWNASSGPLLTFKTRPTQKQFCLSPITILSSLRNISKHYQPETGRVRERQKMSKTCKIPPVRTFYNFIWMAKILSTSDGEAFHQPTHHPPI